MTNLVYCNLRRLLQKWQKVSRHHGKVSYFGVGAADFERRWSHKNFVELAKNKRCWLHRTDCSCGSADENKLEMK